MPLPDHCLQGEDWVDMEDPNVVAEQELLTAAATIEAAAKKLAGLQPKKDRRQSMYNAMPFQEQILEASRAIISASSALVIAAGVAQREHVAAGLVTPRDGDAYLEDSDWSSGLVSAAKVVVAATNSLCEAANAAVQVWCGGGCACGVCLMLVVFALVMLHFGGSSNCLTGCWYE